MKFKENAFLWLLSGSGVIALALAITAEGETAGFFVAVGAVVCFTSAYAGVKAYHAKKEVWTWLLGANAALYNPFVLVHLTRETWNIVDLADIALLIAAGIVLRVREERPVHLNEPNIATHDAPVVIPRIKEYRTPSRTELAVWLTLLILCLAGFYLSQYYAYIEGSTQTVAQNRNVGSATLGLAFWAYLIARVRRWRRPGRIALSGFVAGLVTLFVASAAGGYTKGTEMNGILASIERFDPALAARMKADTDAPGVPLSTMMRGSLSRAVEKASDQAVVTFMAERFAIIQSHNPAALERCVAAFNGGGDFHLNAGEQLRMMRAIGNLYSSAANTQGSRTSDAEHRAEVASLTAMYKTIDPLGILDDDEKKSTLSKQQQCAMYTRLMHELQSLPPKEGAAVVRAMMAS